MGEMSEPRSRVRVSARFARGAVAHPVASVVDQEHVYAELREFGCIREPVRRISRVAVKEENRSSILRGVSRRQIEAMDAHALAVEPNLLALDSEIRKMQIDSRARLKDDAIDEPTQHGIAE